MSHDKEMLIECIKEFDVEFMPLMLAASNMGDWKSVVNGCQALVDRNNENKAEYYFEHGSMPSSRSKIHTRMTDSKCDYQEKVRGISLLFTVFDNSQFSSGKDIGLSDEQRVVLLDFFKKINLDYTKSPFWDAAVLHIHDKTFWKELLTSKPELATHYLSTRSSRISNSNAETIFTKSVQCGNYSLATALLDPEITKAVKSRVDDYQSSFLGDAMRHVVKPENLGSTRFMSRIINDGIKSPLIKLIDEYSNDDYFHGINISKVNINICNPDLLYDFTKRNEAYIRNGMESSFNSAYSKGVILKDIIEEAAKSANPKLFLIAVDFVKSRENASIEKSFEDIFDSKIGHSLDTIKAFMRSIAEEGYDFNAVLDEKGKTVGHRIADLESSPLKLEALLYAKELGLDLSIKDSRKWTPLSYLSADEKKDVNTSLKAMKAKDEALKAVCDIKNELRMDFRN